MFIKKAERRRRRKESARRDVRGRKKNTVSGSAAAAAAGAATFTSPSTGCTTKRRPATRNGRTANAVRGPNRHDKMEGVRPRTGKGGLTESDGVLLPTSRWNLLASSTSNSRVRFDTLEPHCLSGHQTAVKIWSQKKTQRATEK